MPFRGAILEAASSDDWRSCLCDIITSGTVQYSTNLLRAYLATTRAAMSALDQRQEAFSPEAQNCLPRQEYIKSGTFVKFFLSIGMDYTAPDRLENVRHVELHLTSVRKPLLQELDWLLLSCLEIGVQACRSYLMLPVGQRLLFNQILRNIPTSESPVEGFSDFLNAHGDLLSDLGINYRKKLVYPLENERERHRVARAHTTLSALAGDTLSTAPIKETTL